MCLKGWLTDVWKASFLEILHLIYRLCVVYFGYLFRKEKKIATINTIQLQNL